jgi:hypothetical protein
MQKIALIPLLSIVTCVSLTAWADAPNAELEKEGYKLSEKVSLASLEETFAHLPKGPAFEYLRAGAAWNCRNFKISDEKTYSSIVTSDGRPIVFRFYDENKIPTDESVFADDYLVILVLQFGEAYQSHLFAKSLSWKQLFNYTADNRLIMNTEKNTSQEVEIRYDAKLKEVYLQAKSFKKDRSEKPYVQIAVCKVKS